MPTNGGLIGKETHIKKVASNVTNTFNSSGILNSSAKNNLNLELSNIPAIPTPLCGERPENF